MNIPGYKILGPVCYQGKSDCMDVRCRRRIFSEEPRIRPGCMGHHCSYCDEPCGMMGHNCDAANALLDSSTRIFEESEL